MLLLLFSLCDLCNGIEFTSLVIFLQFLLFFFIISLAIFFIELQFANQWLVFLQNLQSLGLITSFVLLLLIRPFAKRLLPLPRLCQCSLPLCPLPPLVPRPLKLLKDLRLEPLPEPCFQALLLLLFPRFIIEATILGIGFRFSCSSLRRHLVTITLAFLRRNFLATYQLLFPLGSDSSIFSTIRDSLIVLIVPFSSFWQTLRIVINYLIIYFNGLNSSLLN